MDAVPRPRGSPPLPPPPPRGRQEQTRLNERRSFSRYRPAYPQLCGHLASLGSRYREPCANERARHTRLSVREKHDGYTRMSVGRVPFRFRGTLAAESQCRVRRTGRANEIARRPPRGYDFVPVCPLTAIFRQVDDRMNGIFVPENVSCAFRPKSRIGRG